MFWKEVIESVIDFWMGNFTMKFHWEVVASHGIEMQLIKRSECSGYQIMVHRVGENGINNLVKIEWKVVC